MLRNRLIPIRVGLAILGALVANSVATPLRAGGTHFNNSQSWAAFDPGSNGVGTDPDGYAGVVFDGRFLYFVPFYNGTDYHGEVLRYDTTAPFTAPTSWATYDAGSHGVGTNPDGYVGAVFDGRYVYFSPLFNGNYHGEVLRYDTSSPFTVASSWATYDAGANGIGTDPDGYAGAAFDGRYVYFAPYSNGMEEHGEVLRYDTTSPFTAASSWATYDAGANGVGTDPDGYYGAVFDGRYVYFVPFHNGTDYHGEVLRYDTTAPFSAASSWATYDAGANGVGTDPDGYAGAVFDGRYVYFVPLDNGTEEHGEVLRYDTTGAFIAASSWATYDAGSNGVGTDPDGYDGAVFDGRYVYFVPRVNGTEEHGEVLRYDTTGAFTAASSWATYDAGTNGVGTDPDGYIGAAFDGRYVYFAPWFNGTKPHGEVLRYSTTPIGIPTVSEWGVIAMAAALLVGGGMVLARRCAKSPT